MKPTDPAPDAPTPARRRGRPPAGERAQRRHRIIDAAFDELVERGYEHVTMLGIARRAGASKETLYAWFGSREGLFADLIEHNADRAARTVQAALDGDAEPRATLTGFAVALLTLLTGGRSVALNRAAMSSPELAGILLTSGRLRTGPLVERYLTRLAADGHLQASDPAEAFRTLYGLVVRDTQIQVLLGAPAPDDDRIAAHAARAVEQFLRLYSPA